MNRRSLVLALVSSGCAGRNYTHYLVETAPVTNPALVGYFWSPWADLAEDAAPPFGPGLVHIDDTEAREHTELFTELNLRAESLRRSAAILRPSHT